MVIPGWGKVGVSKKGNPVRPYWCPAGCGHSVQRASVQHYSQDGAAVYLGHGHRGIDPQRTRWRCERCQGIFDREEMSRINRMQSSSKLRSASGPTMLSLGISKGKRQV